VPDTLQNNKILSSWKQIADFLGVSERTAQHWEQEKGLPVRRVSGAKGRISADAAELERWIQTKLHKVPWYSNVKYLRYCVGLSMALLILVTSILIGKYFAVNHLGPPARCHIDIDTLIVSDQNGREIWRKRFEDRLFAGAYSETGTTDYRKAWFGKLGPDRSVSTLFVYYPVSRETQGTALICFSQTGNEVWRFVPGKVVSDFKGAHSPFYVVSDFHVTSLQPGGPVRILVTSHHLFEHPNQLAVLDERGKTLAEYWHSGYLTHLDVEDINGDGIKEILLGGINNGFGSATLVVLDPRKVGGASAQARGDPRQLRGLGAGTEKAVIFFPRACISQGLQYNRMFRMDAARSLVKAEVAESEDDTRATVIYTFDGNLSLQNVTISDHLKNIHNLMSAKGEIDHPFSDAEEDNLRKRLRILGIGKGL